MAEECLSTPILTYATELNRSTNWRMERSVSPDSENITRGIVLSGHGICVCSAEASRSRSLMQSHLDFCPCCGIGSPDRTIAPWCCRVTGNRAKWPSMVVTCPNASQMGLCRASQQQSGLSASLAALFWCFSTIFRSVCGTVRTTRIDAWTACLCHFGTDIPFTMLLTAVLTALFCSLVRSGTFRTGVGTYGMFNPDEIAETSFCKKMYLCIIPINTGRVQSPQHSTRSFGVLRGRGSGVYVRGYGWCTGI